MWPPLNDLLNGSQIDKASAIGHPDMDKSKSLLYMRLLQLDMAKYLYVKSEHMDYIRFFKQDYKEIIVIQNIYGFSDDFPFLKKVQDVVNSYNRKK